MNAFATAEPPRLLRSFSPEHHSYVWAGRFVDVYKHGDCWVCAQVCDDGAAGVEVARGESLEAAMQNAVTGGVSA